MLFGRVILGSMQRKASGLLVTDYALIQDLVKQVQYFVKIH